MSLSQTLTRWSDRLPPVLVKEVRQMLRGRAFVGAFLAAVCLALLVCISWTMNQDSQPEGEELLAMLSACLLLPAALLVPFGAFQAMSSEWEAGTVDQLHLSTLSPLSLVGGKLLTALLQMLLYVSAFAPFVTLASIAGGVGLEAVATTVLRVMGVCFVLSSWGLALGTFGAHRAARAAMLGLLLVVGGWWARLPLLLFMSGSSMGLGGVSAPSVMVYLLRAMVFYLVPGVAALAIAATRMAHPATNTSTPLRWTSTACLVLTLLGSTVTAHIIGMNQRQYGASLAVLVLPLALVSIFFCTEPERLPRPVRARLLAARHERPFEAFWLPGGGRGVAWFWLHGALLIGLGSIFGVGLPNAFGNPASGFDVTAPALAALLLTNLYVVGLASAFRGWARTRGRRILLRWLPVILALGGSLGLGFLSLVVGFSTELDSVLNPFWVVDQVVDNGLANPAGTFVLLTGVASGLLGLGWAREGLREVRKLHGRRRERGQS